MIGTRLVRCTAWLFVITVGIAPSYLAAQQGAPSSKAAPDIGQFYQDLVEHYDPVSTSRWDGDKLEDVGAQILAATSDKVSNALPEIFVALGHRDDNVKLKAAYGLWMASLRPDGATLLSRYVREIAKLYNSDVERLQAMPNAVFSSLYPIPAEALTDMLAFTRRTDRIPVVQSGTMGALLSIAPDDPRVLPVLDEYLSRSLDEESRVNILNAIPIAHFSDTYRVRKLVAGELGNPAKNVKIAAIHVLELMGRDALADSEPRLRALTQSSSEPVEVKTAANEALKKIAH